MPNSPAMPTEPSPERRTPLQLRITSFSIVRAAIIVAVGLIVLRVFVAAGTVLWWLAIATAVAAMFRPGVAFLQRFMPTWVAILIALFAVFAAIGLIGYRGWAELSAQFTTLQANAVSAATDIQSSDQFGEVAREFGLVDKTRQFFDELPLVISGGGGDSGAAAAVQSAASSGGALFSIGMFALLMLIFGPKFVRAGLQQIEDEPMRARVSDLVYGAYHASARYAWLMAVRAVVVGVLGGLACYALGMETPTVLGVVFALFSLIPGLGIVLAAIPIAVTEAITSVPAALVFIFAAVVVQSLEVSFVQKRIDDASVHVGAAATLVAALLGLQLYGFGGALAGLALAVYGLAVLRGLTQTHQEVFTAVRELVGEDDNALAGEGNTATAEEGADVFATGGAAVGVEADAHVVADPDADADADADAYGD